MVFWFVFLGSASGCLRFFWGCFSSGLFFCRPAAVKFRRKSLCFEAFFFAVCSFCFFCSVLVFVLRCSDLIGLKNFLGGFLLFAF